MLLACHRSRSYGYHSVVRQCASFRFIAAAPAAVHAAPPRHFPTFIAAAATPPHAHCERTAQGAMKRRETCRAYYKNGNCSGVARVVQPNARRQEERCMKHTPAGRGRRATVRALRIRRKELLNEKKRGVVGKFYGGWRQAMVR